MFQVWQSTQAVHTDVIAKRENTQHVKQYTCNYYVLEGWKRTQLVFGIIYWAVKHV